MKISEKMLNDVVIAMETHFYHANMNLLDYLMDST